MEDKVYGYLFGSALGDALGAPVEFMPLELIKSRYGESGIQIPPQSASWTDDTEMMISLTKGLLPVFLEDSLETIMLSVSKSFIAWLDNPGLAPGNTCMLGAYALKQGIHWRKSGVKTSKGCGSAMRSGIVGLLYHNNILKLREVASASGIATHAHPTADAACIGAAFLIKFALEGKDPSQFPQLLLNSIGGISTEFDEIVSKTEILVKESVPPSRALPQLGEGWVGEEAVALAVYCVMTNPNDYVAGVRQAVNITGDSDSVGCITGGILGTRLGIQGIPDDWIERLDEKNRLNDLG
ncbi:MAG: ADP-ribosylglycohydrolase family protein, partial [Promethearchaeota archaeon]